MSTDIVAELCKIPDWFWVGFGFICNTIFSALIGHKIRLGGDACERRRLFRTRMDVLLARLEDTHDMFTFYRDTFQSVRDECASIQRDVYWFRRKRLNEAARQYYSMPQVMTRPSGVGNTVIVTGTKPPKKERAEELLKQMRDYAK